MSLEIIESPSSINDVMSIAEYLADKSSLNTSDKFLAAVKTTQRQLASMPGMGTFRDYGPRYPGLKVWRVTKFPNYLIFYQTNQTELIILRIIHGAQDIDQIFAASDTE